MFEKEAQFFTSLYFVKTAVTLLIVSTACVCAVNQIEADWFYALAIVVVRDYFQRGSNS